MELVARFLAFLLTSGGAGAAVFGIIQWLENVAPPGHPLSSNTKFVLSVVLAILLPILAYAVELALGITDFSPDGAFAAMGTAWLVSQGIHRTTEPDKVVTRADKDGAVLDAAERGD